MFINVLTLILGIAGGMLLHTIALRAWPEIRSPVIKSARKTRTSTMEFVRRGVKRARSFRFRSNRKSS